MSDEGLQRLQQHHEEKSKRIEKNILKYYKVTLGRNESKLRKKKKKILFCLVMYQLPKEGCARLLPWRYSELHNRLAEIVWDTAGFSRRRIHCKAGSLVPVINV